MNAKVVIAVGLFLALLTLLVWVINLLPDSAAEVRLVLTAIIGFITAELKSIIARLVK